jgi:clan AA aspartic protease
MGAFKVPVAIAKASSVWDAEDDKAAQAKIQWVTYDSWVDTGAGTLVITKEICESLGLRTKKGGSSKVAGGKYLPYRLTEPVMIRCQGRDTDCRAMVFDEGDEVLLGAIPLEGMDFSVDPTERKLFPAHGDDITAIVL